jgi:NADP-dependent aldehyde dehydrogenase
VAYRDIDALRATLDGLEGQLTITVHAETADRDAVAALLPTLERRAGRLILNDWPTGVEVNDTMVHGGPFPATSNAAFTSVGATAIDRFLRPVCYQDFPDDLLPEGLQERNPLGIARLRDGKAE